MALIQVVDDEAAIRGLLRRALAADGHDVIEAGSGPEAVDLYHAHRPSCVLVDMVLPGFDGLVLLEKIRTADPDAAVVMVTGAGNTETAIRAMSAGACDYLTKPLLIEQVRDVVRRIIEARADTEPGQRPDGGSKETVPVLLGNSRAMLEVSKLVGRAAPLMTTVLVSGESGTGKELVARALHKYSPRRAGPFIAVNSAAIPDALLEGELFGHEKGAFTGAAERRIGKFELAREGTLFLDEIGETNPATQAKLLRVLQEHEFYRLGGTEAVQSTARVVAATNRDLRAESVAGRFREDLLYRLGVILIHLPPLRERPEDIPALAENFLEVAAREFSSPAKTLTPKAVEALHRHNWPGNVRELGNVIRQAVLFAKGPSIQESEILSALPQTKSDSPVGRSIFDPLAVRAQVENLIAEGKCGFLADMIASYEDVIIRSALEVCGNNVSKAAKHLGIHRVTVKSRIVDT